MTRVADTSRNGCRVGAEQRGTADAARLRGPIDWPRYDATTLTPHPHNHHRLSARNN